MVSTTCLGVLIRRGQVFLRRARLLPIVILLYLAYALAPLYMPSLNPSSLSSAEHIRYIITARPELIKNLPLKNLDKKINFHRFIQHEDFEKYLLSKYLHYFILYFLNIFVCIEIRTWQSDHHRIRKKLIGLRIPSSDALRMFRSILHVYPECHHNSCLPIYSLFSIVH